MVDLGAIFRPFLHGLLIRHLLGGVLRQLQLPIELVFNRDIQGYRVGVHPLCRLIPRGWHDCISFEVHEVFSDRFRRLREHWSQ